MAKTSMKIKQQRPAKFSTREYNRCNLWPSTRIFKKIRHLPYLLPRVSLQGRNPGSKEGKLVGRKQLSESEPQAKDELSARPSANLSEAEPQARAELS